MPQVFDSSGRALPRQMIQIKRSIPEKNVIRTELRFVAYESRKENANTPANEVT